MGNYVFTYYYDPAPDRSNPFRAVKSTDQAAQTLRDFPGVLAAVLRYADIASEVIASPDQSTNGKILVKVNTSLTEEELYAHVKKVMNHLDLYGSPIVVSN